MIKKWMKQIQDESSKVAKEASSAAMKELSKPENVMAGMQAVNKAQEMANDLN